MVIMKVPVLCTADIHYTSTWCNPEPPFTEIKGQSAVFYAAVLQEMIPVADEVLIV